MKFNLLAFEFHEVDGHAYFKLVIEKDGERIEHDEMLLRENKEDVEFLKSIETYVRTKAGDKEW